MSRHDAEILVVGGGPAGAALAARAAGEGADVLLIDRARFPRDKVCGEFLSAEGCAVLERLGLPDSVTAGCPRMGSLSLTDRSGRPIELPLPRLGPDRREAIGLSRRRMDLALVELAARRGARIEERYEAMEPLIEAGRIAGVKARSVGSGAPGRPIRAAQVIAADGRRSALLRRIRPTLGDPLRSDPKSWFGLKAHLPRTAAFGADRVELHLFEGGYAGVAPVESDRLNLCLMVTVRALRECAGSPDRLLRERILENPAAAASLGGARPCSRWYSVGPLRFGSRSATERGMLLLGDAAGTVDPFCGEGMSNALVAAEIAAPFALRAVAQGGLDRDLAAGYASAWRRQFAAVTRRSRWLGRLLQQPAAGGAALWFLRGPGRVLAPRLVAATRTGLRT